MQQRSKTVNPSARLIAEQLLSRIEAGEFKTRLPAERHLAHEFGVTRNTIRSALDFLEERNAISRRAGSGNFIHETVLEAEASGFSDLAQSSFVAENTGPQKLQAVSGIFEPELVRQAVVHTTPKNLDALRKIVERMELIHANAKNFVQCEESFCLQLARGTENPLLIAIYQLITDVRRLSNWKTQRQKRLTLDRIQEAQLHYRSMYDAIEHGDADLAIAFFRSQMFDEQDGAAGSKPVEPQQQP